MNANARRSPRKWWDDERQLLADDSIYSWSVGILVVSLALVLISVATPLWDNKKLILGIAAGFVVISEGVIDLCKDHSQQNKLRLDVVKLLYRIVGVAVAVAALTVG